MNTGKVYSTDYEEIIHLIRVENFVIDNIIVPHLCIFIYSEIQFRDDDDLNFGNVIQIKIRLSALNQSNRSSPLNTWLDCTVYLSFYMYNPASRGIYYLMDGRN